MCYYGSNSLQDSGLVKMLQRITAGYGGLVLLVVVVETECAKKGGVLLLNHLYIHTHKHLYIVFDR